MTVTDGLRARIRFSGQLDLASTLWPAFPSHSGPDGVWRATRTPDGPGSEHLWIEGEELCVEAWGAGSAWLLEHAARLVGDRADADDFGTPHPLIRDLQRRHRGLRIPRTEAVYEAAVVTVLAQLVTSEQARASRRRLLWELGEEAPGPGRLRLLPEPKRLLSTPYWTLHRLGVERRRAETLYRVALHASRLEETVSMDLPSAYRRLAAIGGLGEWSAAEIALVALGDRDAVAVGDYHLPHLVSWALAGEERGTDARMLDLLEPYRGHRGRVLRLLVHGHLGYPQHGPKHAVRRLDRI